MSDMETSVTIKYPEVKRYEGAPWAVFKGGVDQIKHQMVAYFGWDVNALGSASLHELTLMANDAVKAGGAVQGILGGKVVVEGDKPAQAAQEGPTGPSVWDQVDGEAGGEQRVSQQPENPNAGLIGLLNEAATVDDLKRLWATNREAFAAEDVQAAYSARGKALSAQSN